ncbi:MAG: response regulator [Desulfuromonadales bacterium]|nr:response regulator [Desulfuromonadales bacterium]
MKTSGATLQRILIIEDQATLAAMLQKRLQEQGYHSESAGDGIAALKLILSAPFDLLLLDLQIPGLHGVELLRKLRASSKTATLPVVVMSGVYKGERYRSAMQELGVNAFLEKPFTPQQLQTAISQALPKSPEKVAAPAMGAPAATTPPGSSFDRHLTQAFLRSLSGELILNDGQINRHLVFVNGTPVSLRPGFVHSDFGDFLRRQGKIDDAEYQYYAQSGEFRHNLLVQMGCLHYHELLEQKFSYLTQELLAGFSFPVMTASFQPLTLPPGLQVITVNLAEIILQGLRSTWTAAHSTAYFTKIKNHYPTTTPDYYRHINSLRLSEAECALLPLLTGSQRTASCTAGEAELLPLLYLFQSFGMIRCSATPTTAAAAPLWPLRCLFNAPAEVLEDNPEWGRLESFNDLRDKSPQDAVPVMVAPTTPPAAAPPEEGSTVAATFAALQGKNYYEVLGLTQEKFSFNRLKENYFARSKEFGPDLLMRLGGAEANQAEEIMAMFANAYETLSDVVKKEKYDQLLGSETIGLGHKGDERFRAEIQAQSGKVFIDMEEWDNAEKALKDACAIDPDNGDTLAHLAWAIYRNPQYAASRPTLDRAKQMLNRAITMERTAPAFAFKGWILIDSGQEALAETEFNKALKIDARNTLARKGLRRIQEKREQEKKGIFGRMFGG